MNGTTTAPTPTLEVATFNGALAQGLMRRDGITQASLAVRWRRSEGLVSKYFAGTRTMPYHLLVDLAVTVGMDPSALATVRVLNASCPECSHCAELAGAS